MNQELPIRRRIRSYVRREGRLTPAQQVAIDTLWPTFGLQLDQLPAFSDWFPRIQPITLEIGFGNGASLAQMAEAEPERNFIGIEVHRPGVGHLLKQIDERQLDNIRLFNCDAVDVLKQAIPDRSLNTVQLFFPDPWHKKRHHKRRLVQLGFMELVRAKLEAGGVFHAATDWQDYAEGMMAVLEACKGLRNEAGPGAYSPRPQSRPLTKFEQRGVKLGHGVWDLRFIRG